MLEYDEEADNGRGETVPAGVLTGSAPRELVGVKSNRGDNKGATPYWAGRCHVRAREESWNGYHYLRVLQWSMKVTNQVP